MPTAAISDGTFAARLLLRVVQFVRARGHDGEALCRSVGLTLQTLHDPDARVPYAVAHSLGERAIALTRDNNFGLHLAQDVRDTSLYDAGALMLMASPTIRAGLHRVAHYQRYWGDGQRLTLTPAEHSVLLRFANPASTQRSQRHEDECAVAEMLIGIRFLSGHDLAPRAVRFRHAAPQDLTEHHELFRCRLTFEHTHSELELDAAVLDLPLQHANDAYATIFEQQVERALARLPAVGAMAADVRAAARAALAGGNCTLAGTARVLRVTPRTMQRRLQQEGTSFAELLDALRREMAHECLQKQLTVPEIACLLGYADASAFHHAFKRWTGMSPEQVRNAHRQSNTELRE